MAVLNYLQTNNKCWIVSMFSTMRDYTMYLLCYLFVDYLLSRSAPKEYVFMDMTGRSEQNVAGATWETTGGSILKAISNLLYDMSGYA